MNKKPIPVLAILGPTASGKSQLAMRLAIRLNAEIVGCDSVQIYRGFDIGSSKPTIAEQKTVPHHLIDICDPQTPMDAGSYATAARAVIEDIHQRGKLPIVVGGTGLYFRALAGNQFHLDMPADKILRERLNTWQPERIRKVLMRLDPIRAEQLHPNDHYRNSRALEIRILRKQVWATLAKIPDKNSDFDVLTIILNPDRTLLREKIKQRVHLMWEMGLVEEVRRLLSETNSASSKAMESIGYKQVKDWLLSGETNEDLCKLRIVDATSQYAKRQRVWFKKVQADMECKSEVDCGDALIERILSFLKPPYSAKG